MVRHLKIDENEIVKLILAYLKKKNLYKSYVSLENESQVTLEPFSQETRFFRQLIFEGNFDEAEMFITQFQNKLGQSFNKAIFELKKQKYLELIESKPDVEVLIKILKEIESLVPSSVYKNLCFFLTLKSINDHPEYSDWSIQKGRIVCFEALRPFLKLLGRSFQNQGETYSVDLITIVERLTMYDLQLNEDLRISPFISLQRLISQTNSIMEEGQRSFKLEFLQSNESPNKQVQSQMFMQKNQINSFDDDEFSQSVLIDRKIHLKQIRNSELLENNIMTESSFGDRENDVDQTELQVSRLSLMHQSKISKSTFEKKNTTDIVSSPKNKLAFHNRIKSNEALQNLNELQSYSHQQSPQTQNEQIQNQRRPKQQLYIQQSPKQQQQFELPQQSVQAPSKKSSSGEHDKNIIIERLYISDCPNDGSENESVQVEKSQASGLFNYNFNEIVQAGHLTDTHPIRAATFSSDGEYFAIGTNSKSLRVYAMKSVLTKDCITKSTDVPILFERKNHHLGSIYCIDWSRSGRLIATGSNDKMVKVLVAPDLTDDAEAEFTELRLLGHKGIVRSVCFTHDETKVLSAGQVDTCIRVWDSATGQLIRTLDGHTQAIYCLQVGGDGTYQVSAGQDKTLRIWDLRQSKPMSTISMSSYAEINYVSLSESADNYSLKNIIKGSKKQQNLQLRNQPSLAALAHADGTVSIWDLQSQKCIEQINHHKMDCRCVEFDPTTRYVASASFDSTLTIYDFEKRRQVAQINEHEDRVVLCKWHPFYPFILSTSADSTARIFAPKKFLGSLIRSLNDH